jgi:hypothetical protein
MFGSSLPPVVYRGTHVLFRMFGSSLPPIVCRRDHVLFMLFVFVYVYSGVQHIVCCVFVLFSSSGVPRVSLNCPFLIVPSVFSNVYLWFIRL